MTELLTTISVIVLLTALSLLAIAKAKSRSKGVACLSNQRQIGVGLQSYLADHSSFPTAAGDRWLQTLLGQERGITAVFSCPYMKNRSYAHNRFGSSKLWDVPHLGLGPRIDGTATPDSAVKVSNEMIAVHDPVFEIAPPYSRSGLATNAAHGTSLNVLFCDGHVWSAQRMTMVVPTQNTKRLWNIDNNAHEENW